MKKMKKHSILIGVATLLSGCYYDNAQDLYPAPSACDPGTVTYSGKVMSIIQSNCYSCHGGGSNLGGVNLDGYANLKIYADNGKLAGTIEHKTGYSPMPQGGKLSDCDINVIKKWISDGTQNN